MTAVAGMDGSASGVGDVAARLKVNVLQSNAFGAAILLDGRFPTGDEENLLGSGKFSGRGLGSFRRSSARWRRTSTSATCSATRTSPTAP